MSFSSIHNIELANLLYSWSSLLWTWSFSNTKKIIMYLLFSTQLVLVLWLMEIVFTIPVLLPWLQMKIIPSYCGGLPALSYMKMLNTTPLSNLCVRMGHLLHIKTLLLCACRCCTLYFLKKKRQSSGSFGRS